MCKESLMKFNFLKNRKTLLKVILTSLIILTGLSKCAHAADKKFKVVTTFTIIQDIAQNVAGDAAVVESITKVGAEIHQYDPTPQDITKVLSADLVLWNGLNLELWFKRFFEDVKDVPSVVVTDGIEPMQIQEGSYKGNPNPHAWMSPTLALVYVENIRAALVKYDPKNTEIYNKNAADYIAKIKALDTPLRERLAKIPDEKRWLVTSEGAFSYLARDYNLKEAYLWPINAEQQGTPQQVRRLIDLVNKNHIPVVFSESTISSKPAKQVSNETGAKYGGVLYVDSLSTKDGPVPTYIDLLKVTVETIAKGFEE
ncbi:zinc ABC transporter solute-binding protein [Gilliamella sp. Lep-s21]|nr:zinc ABC transporter solute-binding protein [Gilliamella sp. Lep-s35]MWP68880.1 zinc ABC transporter solute-binding protein [Gilliamella sp. Lep-s5]MWP76896.1 zinc ABC transporter solute-binding protein [Gilliamella sp. Lep-s21]